MSMNKIEGVPEGWELVRIGSPNMGEFYIGGYGDIGVCDWIEKYVNFVIVRKIEPPKPTYVPWTFETCPIGAVVWRKSGKFRGELSAAGEIGAYIAKFHYTYKELLSAFELDGTPCGTVEVHE